MLTTKEILTTEEVMEILKIGRSTFYKIADMISGV